MATTKKPRMTEQQFIAMFKKKGFELYLTEEVKKKYDLLEKLSPDYDKMPGDKAMALPPEPAGYSKHQFTAQMLNEIKGIAAAGYHYQAFILIGVFLKHMRLEYSRYLCNGCTLFETEIQEALQESTKTYRPAPGIKFSSSDHMVRHKSGARILSIHETIEEIEQEIERRGLLKEEDFLSVS